MTTETKATDATLGQNRKLGIISAVLVIFIWSGFVVFSRSGVQSNLTAFDLAALRFVVAGALTVPFAVAWWPKHLPLRGVLAVTFFGPGTFYALLMYFGMTEASAAYAAVFANGSLPFFSIVLVFLLTSSLPTKAQVVGLGCIMLGAVTVGASGITGQEASPLRGIVMFLTASAFLSIYIFALSHWKIQPKQALAVVNIPNALIFLPIWYFALPSTLGDAQLSQILFQAAFQGLGPGFLAVILFSLASIHFGPTLTSGFSAAVPATAALLAIPVLGEVPSVASWIGIGGVCLGLAIVALRR